MPRYKLTVEYVGTPFVGWQFQAQDQGVSVQGVLEDAFEKFTQKKVRVEGAGRTDAGVHAQGQVAHADLEKAHSPVTIREALNFYLRPYPVVVVECVPTEQTFHARFSAVKRAYRYRILNRKTPPALDRDRVWWIACPLSIEAMQEAAQCLVGKHDFSSFRAASCQSSSAIKTLDLFQIYAQGSEIWFDVQARSFLHHQVRNMVGSLKAVGVGKCSPDHFKQILERKDRSQAGMTAPAQGLYFMQVFYE